MARGRQLEYGILGPLEVLADGKPLALGGAKQRAVLAFLLVHANEVVSTDRLIDTVWGESPPGTAKTALQGYVAALRRELEPERGKRGLAGVLVTEASGYVLRTPPEDVDARRFEAMAAEARNAAPERASRLLGDALALWRGPALADFAYEPWAQAEAERLDELRLVCREELIHSALELGGGAELVPELEALIKEHPLRERPRGQVMLALYRSGRQADALEAYQATRAILVEELGIDPSPELQELNRAILNQEQTLHAARAPARPRSNLPALPTPLVGRERERAEAAALLARPDVRLLTLTGPGGSGKTRLALALAEDAMPGFPDGVRLCELAAATDPLVALSTIGRSVDVGDAGSRPLVEGLQDVLRDRELLLVLDNLEQVLAVAPSLSALLATCSGVRILATSRIPLHVAAEHEYPVGPLDEQSAASLFAQRAQAVRPDFTSNGEVAEICARLDRLPLAIELAASRAKALAASQILERLQQRLPLLTGGHRDAPARQRTLRAAIAWSYDLLDPEEQRLFAQLGVFVGGFTVEAAEQVCDADLDTLTTLVDDSLVVFEDDRYSMLETIGEYARECLRAAGDEDRLRTRHAEWCLDVAERNVEPFFEGGDQSSAARHLAAEQANIVAALEFAREAGLARLALRLAQAMGHFWYFANTHATLGLQQVEATLATFDAPTGPRGGTLQIAGWLAYERGFRDRAKRYGEEALQNRGEMSPLLVGHTLNLLGAVADAESDSHQARSYYEEALNVARASSPRHPEACALNNLGLLAFAEDELEGARALLRQSLEISRSSADARSVALAASNLALVEVYDERHEAAAALVREALAEAQAVQALSPAFSGCAALTLLTAQLGDLGEAARILGVLETISQHTGLVLIAEELQAAERAHALCRAALDPEEFERELGRGRALTAEQGVAYGLAVAERLAQPRETASPEAAA